MSAAVEKDPWPRSSKGRPRSTVQAAAIAAILALLTVLLALVIEVLS
jgi:hypothetical protein